MDIETSARQVREDGYTVVPDFLDEEMLEGLRRGLAPVFDEVGSRLMQRLLDIEPLKDGWIEVQPDVYRYTVMHYAGVVTVRTLIRNYLATEVIWALD